MNITQLFEYLTEQNSSIIQRTNPSPTANTIWRSRKRTCN